MWWMILNCLHTYVILLFLDKMTADKSCTGDDVMEWVVMLITYTYSNLRTYLIQQLCNVAS